MSTKPLIVPAFNTAGGNRTAPDAGLRASGWALNQIPTSGVYNHEQNLYGAWLQYLNDGALVGDHSIGGQTLVFTDFTFTADSATNKLTATAHGLQTGDGPVRVSNSGGALPSGLLAGVDYYVARIDVNTFYLCPTRADAFQRAAGNIGFEASLNDNGTGTQTLLHQAGTTRVSDLSVTRDTTVGGTLTVSGEKVGGTAFSFPSTTFTASATFDTLIFDSVTVGTLHGLQTGSGPMRVSNSGGALPAPLAAGTDYWVIRSVNTKIKLATSFANAMSGVAIDLTTNGTGTQSIVSGTSPTVAGNSTVHGTLQVDGALTASGTLTANAGVTVGANKNVSLSGSGNITHGTWTKQLPANANGNNHSYVTIDGPTIGAWDIMLDQHFQVGDVITAIRVKVTDNGSGTRAQAAFQVITDGATPETNVVAAVSSSGTLGTFQTINISSLSESIAAGKCHRLFVNQSLGTDPIVLWSCEIDWTR